MRPMLRSVGTKRPMSVWSTSRKWKASAISPCPARPAPSKRELAALEHCRELAASEGELRGQVANLETRLAWAEQRHVLERRFYGFALSKGATLEELRDQFPGYRIDHRGTVA